MKIVVIGGSGLIGSKLVTRFRADGHEVLAASPSSGVSTLTGEGLAEALRGAAVVVDVSNSPSFEDEAAMNFFTTTTRNLLVCEATAGVGHHVALSVVGSERFSKNGYLRAKFAQEALIKESPIPYSIVRATQFFEFLESIADAATHGGFVRIAPVLFQPIAADDVAVVVGRVAAGAPLNGTVETAGPERSRFDVLIRRALSARSDPREVIADPHAQYFGAELEERTLVPQDDACLGEIRLEEWLRRSPSQIPDMNPRIQAAAATVVETAALTENEFRVSQVPPGSVLLVGKIAVFNVDGRFCATESKCTHMGAPLVKGPRAGSTVTCPYHGSQFNVCTGDVLRGPAKRSLKTYRVMVEGEVGRIEADRAEPGPKAPPADAGLALA